jgi:hypothetical protein
MNFILQRMYDVDITFKDPKNFKILFIRNSIMTVQILLYTLLQFYIPQPVIQTLHATGPLFVFFLDYKINQV